MFRPVTVPFPFKERELFEHFTFFWAGTVEQFFSFELEQLTSSFLLNWNCWAVLFFWTGTVDQFISFELELLSSSFLLSWDGWPVHFFWAGTGQQFFDSVHTNCWTGVFTHVTYCTKSNYISNLSNFWTASNLIILCIDFSNQHRLSSYFKTAKISDEISLADSWSFIRMNWNCWPVLFFWAGTDQRFFDSVHTNCWTWTVTGLPVLSSKCIFRRTFDNVHRCIWMDICISFR